MKGGLIAIILTCIVLLFFDRGDAIKCFVCNSFHQADCADWFDNVTQHLVKCQSQQGLCRKVVQEVWLNDHWDVRYIRQCATAGKIGARAGEVCQEKYGSYNVRMRYCHCKNQDGCNTATSFRALGIFGYMMCVLLMFAFLLWPGVLTA